MDTLSSNIFISVEKKSRMDTEEEDLSKTAFLFSGQEQIKKSGKRDGSKLDEQAFLFNLF